jgi:hypothetical protein
MKAGLFPFNPDMVLRDIQKPPAQLTVPKANDAGIGSSVQSKVPQTLIIVEAFTSLYSRIEEDAYALDETSR